MFTRNFLRQLHLPVDKLHEFSYILIAKIFSAVNQKIFHKMQEKIGKSLSFDKENFFGFNGSRLTMTAEQNSFVGQGENFCLDGFD